MSTKKTVLITGAAGFLGSHFTDYLLEKDYIVIGVDNLVTGSMDNIKHLETNSNFDFIEHDIINPIELNTKLDYVANLASPASPIDYLELPLETLKVGSYGTHNTLELAKKNNAVYFITSTSEVYGDPLVHPQKEEYWGNVNSVGPRSVYDEAKRYAEAVTMAYHRLYKLDTKIVRIFNTYGPRMRINDGRVVPNFIFQALNNQDITVYGDGSQTRSFCYVADEVAGFYKLITSDINDPVNIGNPNELSILEFAEKIIKATGAESKIVYKDLPKDDPKVRCPDISKAKELLGWEPNVGLDKGINITIESFK